MHAHCLGQYKRHLSLLSFATQECSRCYREILKETQKDDIDPFLSPISSSIPSPSSLLPSGTIKKRSQCRNGHCNG